MISQGGVREECFFLKKEVKKGEDKRRREEGSGRGFGFGGRRRGRRQELRTEFLEIGDVRALTRGAVEIGLGVPSGGRVEDVAGVHVATAVTEHRRKEVLVRALHHQVRVLAGVDCECRYPLCYDAVCVLWSHYHLAKQNELTTTIIINNSAAFRLTFTTSKSNIAESNERVAGRTDLGKTSITVVVSSVATPNVGVAKNLHSPEPKEKVGISSVGTVCAVSSKQTKVAAHIHFRVGHHRNERTATVTALAEVREEAAVGGGDGKVAFDKELGSGLDLEERVEAYVAGCSGGRAGGTGRNG
mmetsp:Transcript_472/g.580  ORF Transcript_472/g.580 Transcript_472/m.580 type:complete len:301 (-) Transcript_472:309-1211(-)